MALTLEPLFVLLAVGHGGAFKGPSLLLQVLLGYPLGVAEIGREQVGSAQVNSTQVSLTQVSLTQVSLTQGCIA
jgi:hypothetical protein